MLPAPPATVLPAEPPAGPPTIVGTLPVPVMFAPFIDVAPFVPAPAPPPVNIPDIVMSVGAPGAVPVPPAWPATGTISPNISMFVDASTHIVPAAPPVDGFVAPAMPPLAATLPLCINMFAGVVFGCIDTYDIEPVAPFVTDVPPDPPAPPGPT